jgi:hypothetical protein
MPVTKIIKIKFLKMVIHKIKKYILPKNWLYFIIYIIVPFFVKAEECDPEVSICNPIKAQSFKEFIQLLTEIILKIGMPLAALMIILSGFMFVKARGNPEELKKAKAMFVWTLVGTAIIIGSYVIATAVVNFAKGL